MERSIEFPIIVVEGGDISVFWSTDAVQISLEPVDVEDGIYDVFDAVGNILTCVVVDGSVRLSAGTLMRSDSDSLKMRLRQFVEHVGPERVGLQGAEYASLETLVAAVAKFLNPK